MEKITTQTVYVAVNDNSDKRFGWVINSEGKGVLPVEMKEDQVIMSIKEFKEHILKAYIAGDGDAYKVEDRWEEEYFKENYKL